MNIEKLELNNITKNIKLNEKLNIILNDNNLESQYEKCKALLEYMNIRLIINNFKQKMEDYNITRIIEFYRKTDENLYEQMKGINSTYNIVDERELEKEDVEYILLKINYIYGYIKERYGEVI